MHLPVKVDDLILLGLASDMPCPGKDYSKSNALIGASGQSSPKFRINSPKQ
jgi:hypothetical protein